MEPLPAYVDSLEAVPEALRGIYVPYDGNDASMRGKHVLNVARVGGWSLSNVANLETTLGRYKSDLSAAMAASKAWAGLELTPEDVQTRMARLTELEAIDPEKEADKLASQKAEARIQAATKTHERELGKVTTRAQAMEKQIGELLVNRAAADAIAAHNKGKVTRPLVEVVEKRIRTRVNEATGRIEAFVVDDFGNPIYEDAEKPFEALVLALKADDEYAALFTGTEQSGSGPSPQSMSTPPRASSAGPKSSVQKISDGMAAIARGGLVPGTKVAG